jgi:hypothetical protein
MCEICGVGPFLKSDKYNLQKWDLIITRGMRDVKKLSQKV